MACLYPLNKVEEKIMKTVNLHNGIYHCQHCFIEYELFEEASLKCESCDGFLIEGSLDDSDDESQDDDSDDGNGE